MSFSETAVFPSIRAIALALGGDVVGPRQVVAPAPGHSRRDRSMSVAFPKGGTDFRVNSFAGEDWRPLKDHVRERLGMSADAWKQNEKKAANAAEVLTDEADVERRIANALRLWNEARDARGTVVERYLGSRGLELPDGADILRFHPSCPWTDHETGELMRVPCMLGLYRSIHTDQPRAIHRTRLSPGGSKLGRMALGPTLGTAIKIDADDTVAGGLHIAEGIESALAARQLGYRPTWSLGSAGSIASLPVLPGVEAITIMEENDDASSRAVEACATRWSEAGREVGIVAPDPDVGNDVADVLLSRVRAG